ncbi:hypothetical protein [Burkholderia multivorans]|uniref:hypothetical protein n=1 Tax=Burkholderia multivorans TaxID=87883 RepID=UPI002018C5F6|nr:hypothetical protein [Burkholderia multivorans]MCO1381806.1 hypothetical protein [Burkholderia multivorans]MCO1401946.1 hypothetical protein [Burkholderia multivorans]UQO76347.1 hypothetical protein L0Z12_11035 [Burkholderia multivorans]
MTTAFDRLVDDLAAEQRRIETHDTLAKALEAQRQGLITARDVSVIELLAQRGQTMPEALAKALSAVDAVRAHHEAEHRAADERIALAALDGAGVSMSRVELDKRIAEAQRAGRLRAGDLARAEAAMNLGKPVPADVLARILGNA